MSVDRDNVTPLYQQLASVLRDQIKSGSPKAGAAISPESELTKKFKVSRITVRQAIDLLVSEGLVIRKQGKGTYVRNPKVQQDLRSLQAFAELMAAYGPDQAMQVIAFDFVPVDEQAAYFLNLPLGTNILRIKRLHLLKGIPIAVALIDIPEGLAHQMTRELVVTTPIYTLLTQKANIQIKRATQVIRAVGADREMAKILSVPRGSPLMMVDRVTYSNEEKPVEHIVFFHRNDAYEVTVELHRDPSDNAMKPVDTLTRVEFRPPDTT